MSASLITGADGHIGRALATWMLRHSDDDLLLYVRASGEAERIAKRRALDEFANSGRSRVVFGDLRGEEPFSQVGRAGIVRIFHCAAVTDFAVERGLARDVNVEGTRKVVEFASRCPDLRRIALLSSLYAAGLVDGDLREAPLSRPTVFANHYEWSKWRAEQLLHTRRDLPWQVFRIATLLCDDARGTVTQHNVIHNTLRLLYYGLLSVVPGNPATRVNMTTTDFAVRAIGTFAFHGDDGLCCNVSDSGTDALSLGQLLDVIYAAFMEEGQFAQRRILKPRFCDEASFATLVAGMRQFGGPIAQALDSIAPFAAQLFHDKNVHAQRVTDIPTNRQPGDLSALLRSTAMQLIGSRFRPRDQKRSAA